MKMIYVASYGKGEDKGIYTLSFDPYTIKLKKEEHIPTKDFPSYMITRDDHLYVAYKNADNTNDGGGLGSFLIEDNKLIKESNYSSSGRSYTHLCLSDDQEYIFAANYHIGATASYKVNDHKIDHKIVAVRHKGFGPDLLKRQTSPHVHNVGFTPDKRFVYSVDLGSDRIVMYDYKDGQLEENKDYSVSVIPGSGPRHMIFSQDGRFAYLVNEIANSVMVFKVADNHFSLIQNVSCIPHHFTGFSAAAAIRMTSTGKHLFISNRGHDSIALYRINQETGKISLLYMVHTDKDPRDFNIIDDAYLIVACQNGNLLQVMSFDEENEKLLLTPQAISLPQPVCVAL